MKALSFSSGQENPFSFEDLSFSMTTRAHRLLFTLTLLGVGALALSSCGTKRTVVSIPETALTAPVDFKHICVLSGPEDQAALIGALALGMRGEATTEVSTLASGTSPAVCPVTVGAAFKKGPAGYAMAHYQVYRWGVPLVDARSGHVNGRALATADIEDQGSRLLDYAKRYDEARLAHRIAPVSLPPGRES